MKRETLFILQAISSLQESLTLRPRPAVLFKLDWLNINVAKK